MTSQGQGAIRELDSRVNGGIHVRLVWCEHDGRVLVTIYDAQTSRHHCIEVRDGERALQVFHHPYAYLSDAAPPNPLAECARNSAAV